MRRSGLPVASGAPAVLDDDGHGHLRVVRRCEGREPGVRRLRGVVLGRAALTGDGDAGDPRERAGSLSHDDLHHLSELGGDLRRDGAAALAGLGDLEDRQVGGEGLLDEVGLEYGPPLAIAAATWAICERCRGDVELTDRALRGLRGVEVLGEHALGRGHRDVEGAVEPERLCLRTQGVVAELDAQQRERRVARDLERVADRHLVVRRAGLPPKLRDRRGGVGEPGDLGAGTTESSV